MDLASLNDILATIDGYIGGSSWFVFALLGSGIFFTVYLKFLKSDFLSMPLMWCVANSMKKSERGYLSFQSLATALSGTVGTGNIAGVAFMIHLGGPAALFGCW